MAIKASTGLRNRVLDTGAVRDVLNLGFIKIYAGTVPATADATLGSATLLCTISVDDTGTGLTFEPAAASGVIAKASGETWTGTNIADGTATFYRHVVPGDTGGASTSQVRLQGTVAMAGGDMNLSSVFLSDGASQNIDFYTVALPTF